MIVIVLYMDAPSHSYFYDIAMFGIMSLLFSVIFYLVENYLPLFGYYGAYSDNLSIRFLLTVFAVMMITFLSKLAVSTLEFERNPSLIDIYKDHFNTCPNILDLYLDPKLDNSSCKRLSPNLNDSMIKSRRVVEVEMVPV